MIEVSNITFSYSEAEDRLLLNCAGQSAAQTLLLTRRVTRRLLGGFAEALVRTSPSLVKVPADLRREVIVLEHFSSLATEVGSGNQPGPTGEATSAEELGQALVWKVDLEIQPTMFRLAFHSGERPLVTLGLTRRDFHKLLAALDRWALVAEWNIRGDAGWLNDAEAIAVSPGGRSAS